MILSNIFSLRKQNRALTRRIRHYEENYKERLNQRIIRKTETLNAELNDTLNPGLTDDSFEQYPEVIASPKAPTEEPHTLAPPIQKAFASSQGSSQPSKQVHYFNSD